MEMMSQLAGVLFFFSVLRDGLSPISSSSSSSLPCSSYCFDDGSHRNADNWSIRIRLKEDEDEAEDEDEGEEDATRMA